MTRQIALERITTDLFRLLEETFEQVQGIYLDKGTSLFETLATITAEEASRPVSARCASIAAQVEHVRFYIEVLQRYMRGEKVGEVNWQVAWQRTSVSPEEWGALVGGLRDAHRSVLTMMRGFDTWEGEDDIGGPLAIIVHTAYHLGEIRQALCTIQR